MWSPPAARTSSSRYENSSQTRLSMSQSTVLIAAVIRSAFIQPARSPDLTVCDFFLWEHIKNKVYIAPIAPLSANINDIKDKKAAAINSVDRSMLRRVWDEFSYQLDVVRAAGGVHIEHL